ncbi:hypothetical protein SAMN02745857_00192 [Andreprevotia lacus DSM 23236]|jgi:hypothetical protein|uniref:Lipoprotein n=1 Tax=Andreprevotia lacus DSM 23236 TaxID=1121001 RepID=A0A1W1WXJ9_9NEIS|nr:hypothetical protein [Andreprevotia lacus]SMC16449.1 hypothetical protein SAMN02745857_00192 [Andreprevotia lacus DSM 23236]
MHLSPLRFAVPAMVAMLLAACQSEPLPDRHASPEAALQAARAALHQHDLAGYFDALADGTVRDHLANAIMICTMTKSVEGMTVLRNSGHPPSTGCIEIEKKYGWRDPVPGNSPSAFRQALQQVKQPREFVTELEGNHRRTDSGTSFVWEYLDNVKLTRVEIHGGQASAQASWGGETRTVYFERDQTGWRFKPHALEE